MGSVVHIYVQVAGDETRACVCMYISACLCATYLCLSYIFYEFDCVYNPVETLTTSWQYTYSIIRHYANLTSRSIKWRGAHKVLFAACGAQMVDAWWLVASCWGGYKQPVIRHQPSVCHQYVQNSCLWLFHLCLLDNWGGDHWLPQVGLCDPWPWINFWPCQFYIIPVINAIYN